MSSAQQNLVKVRIGIAHADRVVELEIEDGASFEQYVSEQLQEQEGLVWFEDNKHRRVGVPRSQIAYIEIETRSTLAPVGFSNP